MLNYDDIKIIDEIYSEGYLFAQYGIYIKKKFKQKIFKIPVDIGLGCPHKKMVDVSSAQRWEDQYPSNTAVQKFH